NAESNTTNNSRSDTIGMSDWIFAIQNNGPGTLGNPVFLCSEPVGSASSVCSQTAGQQKLSSTVNLVVCPGSGLSCGSGSILPGTQFTVSQGQITTYLSPPTGFAATLGGPYTTVVNISEPASAPDVLGYVQLVASLPSSFGTAS